MSENVSRRSVLKSAAIVAASASAGAALVQRGEAAVSKTQKISHADAKYQPVPNGQQRCAICLQFEPPDHCKIVQSPISANGWCQYFAARENAR